MAIDAQLHTTPAWTARAKPMRTPVPHPGNPSSQRLTLAGKSTPTPRKKAPSSPDEHVRKPAKSPERRHATGPPSSAASNAAPEKKAAPEANRISAPRFDQARS